jgi:transposase-like protein
MSQGKPRDTRKEQQWRRWIRQWQRSGLSVRAFCARHDLSQPSFYAWRREIQQRNAAAGTFVPVQFVSDDEPVSSSIFEVVLPGGPTLRVPPGFDVATLRQLLAVLREVRSC